MLKMYLYRNQIRCQPGICNLLFLKVTTSEKLIKKLYKYTYTYILGLPESSVCFRMKQRNRFFHTLDKLYLII